MSFERAALVFACCQVNTPPPPGEPTFRTKRLRSSWKPSWEDFVRPRRRSSLLLTRIAPRAANCAARCAAPLCSALLLCKRTQMLTALQLCELAEVSGRGRWCVRENVSNVSLLWFVLRPSCRSMRDLAPSSSGCPCWTSRRTLGRPCPRSPGLCRSSWRLESKS